MPSAILHGQDIGGEVPSRGLRHPHLHQGKLVLRWRDLQHQPNGVSFQGALPEPEGKDRKPPTIQPVSPDLEALPYLGNFQAILGKVGKPIPFSHQCSWNHHPPPPPSELSLQDAPGRKGVYKKGASTFLFHRTGQRARDLRACVCVQCMTPAMWIPKYTTQNLEPSIL